MLEEPKVGAEVGVADLSAPKVKELELATGVLNDDAEDPKVNDGFEDDEAEINEAVEDADAAGGEAKEFPLREDAEEEGAELNENVLCGAAAVEIEGVDVLCIENVLLGAEDDAEEDELPNESAETPELDDDAEEVELVDAEESNMKASEELGFSVTSRIFEFFLSIAEDGEGVVLNENVVLDWASEVVPDASFSVDFLEGEA